MRDHSKLIGTRVPFSRLGEMVDGQMRTVRAADLVAFGRSLIIGVPGGFTPVCTEKHLPNFIRNADRLRASGFTQLVCVVASDPFVVEAWSKIVDPERKIRFLSDGNLTLARALDLVAWEPKLFFGERSERYLLTTHDGLIEGVRVEVHLADLTCTQVDDLVLEDA